MPEEEQGTGNGPSAPPLPLPLTQDQKRKQYFISLGYGLIPVVLFLLGFGMMLGGSQGSVGLALFLIGFLLYIVELIVAIVLLINKRRRFAGYGLLTAFLVTPIITAIGCTVFPNLIHTA